MAGEVSFPITLLRTKNFETDITVVMVMYHAHGME
jgi:hypothetical protein